MPTGASSQHYMDPDLCFILMPFAASFAKVFQVVQRVVEDYSCCKCLRADQIATPSQITGDIWDRIQSARFLIADVTGANPNVFYEVGFSHALHKNVILLVEEGNPVPFDIQGIRYIKYITANLGSLREELVPFVRQSYRQFRIGGKQILLLTRLLCEFRTLTGRRRVPSTNHFRSQFMRQISAPTPGKDTYPCHFPLA
jgi:hypothetical protein